MENKSKLNTVLLVIIIILLIAGLVYFFFYKNSKQQNNNSLVNNISQENQTQLQNQNNDEDSSINDEQQKLLSYSDNGYGLSFEYSPDLIIKRRGGDILFQLKSTTSNSQLDKFKSYLKNSPLVSSFSVISTEERIKNFKDTNPNSYNDSESLKSLKQMVGPSVYITLKKVKYSLDPDEIFGNGFTVQFMDILQNMIFTGFIANVYSGDKLIDQIYITFTDKTIKQFKDDYIGNKLEELNDIVWSIKQDDTKDKDGNYISNDVALNGIKKSPISGTSKFLPVVSIRNTEDIIFNSENKPLVFTVERNGVDVADRIMKNLIIK